MSVAAARAMCAGLDVRPWDTQVIGRAVHAVSAQLLAVSPQVTPERPGVWWIGASGLPREAGLLARLRALGAQWHPDARAGIASSCVAAQAATWLRGPTFAVPPGGDRAFLSQVPLSLIPMDGDLRATLVALGLATAGQLAELDPGDVEQRFGPAGLSAWRLARGDDRRRAMLARPAPGDTVELDLPVPAETLEPILFLVRAALGRLLEVVRRDAQAIARLELVFLLDETARRLADPRPSTGAALPAQVTVAAARPLARLEPLYEQCRAALEGFEVEAPVVGIVVRVVERAATSGEQGNLLHTGWRDPAAADAAFARLRAALGPDTVVRPAARDAFVPERRGAWERAEHAANRPAVVHARSVAPAAMAPSTVFRLLDPAEPVTTDEASFIWRGRMWPITSRRGKERLSGEWWKAPYARDYCRWESEGALFLAWQDGARWYLQGWWD
jgi:protein ImuB